MGELIQRDFVQPYPQQALGGELGLTSEDVARSLGVDHKHVLEKLRRARKDKWEELGWTFAVYTADVENTGIVQSQRRRQVFALNTTLAKVIVARWNNEIGDGYLSYLFDCEAQTERLIPRLKAALEAFMAPKHRRTPKGIRVTVQRPVIRFGLFGPICEIETETKLVSQLSPDELELYKNIHAARTMEGLTKAQRQRAENPRLYLLPKPEGSK
jgi:hypothetical protein